MASKSKRTESGPTLVRAGLLLIGSLVSSFATAEHLPGSIDVTAEGQYVNVHAYRAPLDAVLEALAERAGFRLVRFTRPTGNVTIRIVGVTTQAALQQLLPDHSYQFFRSDDSHVDADATDMLWLIADGAPVELVAVDFLESVLLNGDVREKQQAIAKLREIASPAAIQALSFALGDELPNVQRSAMAALQRIGNDEALAAIASASVGAGTDAWLRGEAAAALAGDSAASALRYLQEAMNDDDANVRMAALDSLSELTDDRAVELLNRALMDPDPSVREHAADALEHVSDEVAFQAMMATMPD